MKHLFSWPYDDFLTSCTRSSYSPSYKSTYPQQSKNCWKPCRECENRSIFSQFFRVRPKIKFCLFAIAYLPALLLPTQPFFFAFPEVIFFFFAVSIVQFVWNTKSLQINKKKKNTGIAFIPHFLSLFLLSWLPYLFRRGRRGNFIQSN